MSTIQRRRGGPRRRPLTLASERSRRLRLAWKQIRDYLPTATLAICHASHLSPSNENISRARQSLYLYARCRTADTDFNDCFLLESLASVCQGACLLETPLFEWQTSHDGRTCWPVIKWPNKSGHAQMLAVQAFKHIASVRTQMLWDWYIKEMYS